jgi:hypothetical protein
MGGEYSPGIQKYPGGNHPPIKKRKQAKGKKQDPPQQAFFLAVDQMIKKFIKIGHL